MTHVPPSRYSSASITLAPCPAATRAARIPPDPPPITNKSTSNSASREGSETSAACLDTPGGSRNASVSLNSGIQSFLCGTGMLSCPRRRIADVCFKQLLLQRSKIGNQVCPVPRFLQPRVGHPVSGNHLLWRFQICIEDLCLPNDAGILDSVTVAEAGNRTCRSAYDSFQARPDAIIMIRGMARSAGFEDRFAVLDVLCVAEIRCCSRKYEHRNKRADLSCAFHWQHPSLDRVQK